jgi:hypothetical protein
MKFHDVPYNNDIFHLLFTKYKLDVNQSYRFGLKKILEKGVSQSNPFAEEHSSASFWNYSSNYSYMSYWKAGHTMVNKILEGNGVEGTGFWKSPFPMNNTVVVPFKDPLDKLMSAYFTSSAFKVQHKDIYDLTQSPTAGNYESLVNDTYELLDNFMRSSLEFDSFSDIGYYGEVNPSSNLLNYNNHFIPIHILLYYALANKEQGFKLVGFNLDQINTEYLFKDIVNNNKIDEQFKSLLLVYKTANNKFLKTVAYKWKIDNPDVASQIINKFLSNDYKLIWELQQNSMLLDGS